MWIFLTAVVLAVVGLPLWTAEIDFPFWGKLITFVLVLMIGIRYTFFLRHSWLASQQWIKVGLFVVGIWGTFLLINEIHDFRVFADEVGLETLLGHLPEAKHQRMYGYIHAVMLFFGIASVIATVVLMLRLLISVWRWHNFKKV